MLKVLSVLIVAVISVGFLTYGDNPPPSTNPIQKPTSIPTAVEVETPAETPTPVEIKTLIPRIKVEQEPEMPFGDKFGCDCSKTCPEMSSCTEAQYQLNSCGCSRRDADNDGVACDTQCQ